MYKITVNTLTGNTEYTSVLEFDADLVSTDFANSGVATSGYIGTSNVLGAKGATITIDPSNWMHVIIAQGQPQQVNVYPILYVSSTQSAPLTAMLNSGISSETFPQGQANIPYIDYVYRPSGYQQMASSAGIYGFNNIYPITKMPYNDIVIEPTLQLTQYDRVTMQSLSTSRYYFSDYLPSGIGALPIGDKYNSDLWEHGFYDDGAYIYAITGWATNVYFGRGTSRWIGLSDGNFEVVQGATGRKALNASSYTGTSDNILPQSPAYLKFGLMGEYTLPNGRRFYGIIPETATLNANASSWYNIYFTQRDSDIDYFRMSFGRSTESGYGLNVEASTFVVADYGLTKIDEMRRFYTRIPFNAVDVDLAGSSAGNYLVDSTVFYVYHGTNSFYSLYGAFFSPKILLSAFAAMGYAISLKQGIAQYAITGDKIDCPWILRGNMTSDGKTDGTYALGADANDQPQGKWGDITDSPYIPIDPTDDDSAVDTGDLTPNTTITVTGASDFTTLYALNASAVSTLGQKLWEGIRNKTDTMIANFFSIDDTNATYYYNNIIDYFCSLKYYPFTIADITDVTIKQGVAVGAGASAIYIGGGLQQINNLTPIFTAGSIEIPATHDDFRDYEPYVSITAYVPFCGSVELTPSEVVGATITLQYAVDLVSGECTAYIVKQSAATQIVAALNGTMGYDVLITGNNAASQAGSYISSLANKLISPIMQLSSPQQAAGALTQTALETIVNTPSYMALSPMAVGNSRSLSGLLNPLQFAIVIKRHSVKIPDDYGHAVGYVINKTAQLSSMRGYTVCQNVDLSGITATAAEKAMIAELLQTGVYL